MSISEKLTNSGLLISFLSDNLIQSYTSIKSLNPRYNLILFKENQFAIAKRISGILEKHGISSEILLVDENNLEFASKGLQDFINLHNSKNIYYLVNNENGELWAKMYQFLRNNKIRIFVWKSKEQIISLNSKKNVTLPITCKISLEEHLNCIGLKLFNSYKVINAHEDKLEKIHVYLAGNFKHLFSFFSLLEMQIAKLSKLNIEEIDEINIKNNKVNHFTKNLLEIFKDENIIEDYEIEDFSLKLTKSNVKLLHEICNNWFKIYIRNLFETSMPESIERYSNVTLDWYKIKLLPIALPDILFDMIYYYNNKIYLIKIDYFLGSWKSSVFIEEILCFSLLNNLVSSEAFLCFPFEIPQHLIQMADAKRLHIFDVSSIRNISKFLKSKVLLD